MAASFVEMRAASCPSQDLATTNLAFVSPEDAARLGARAEAGPVVFSVQAHPGVEPGSFALNTVQRRLLRVSAGDPVDVRPWPGPALPGEVFTLELAFVTNKPGREEEIDAEVLARSLGGRFAGQVFTEGQRLVVEYIGTNFIATVQGVLCAGDPASRGAPHEGSRAEVSPGGGTSFTFATPSGSGIRVVNQKAQAQQLFKQKDFNFESLGIGGLDRQFDEIFRRAFASRVYPAHVVAKLGIHHVKGMLLHGPPGTGKTLIARQIGKMLNGKEPKVVKGPEILSKYVGASEENIRNLFADAEEEQASKGEESELHIIIFDEIDSICKQRGSARDGTGVHDTIVNQLLTKIDGVDALNNILLIGMTNRKDMLDDAMLRPGRLEVQIEIGLPDEGGRQQILQIHTSKMDQHQFLDRGVDTAALAARTQNYSGAELEGLVKSATSFALNRNVDVSDLSAPLDEENLKVEMGDFENALQEVKPAFGAAVDSLEALRTYGMYEISEGHSHVMATCRMLVQQLQRSEKNPLMTCMLQGAAGAGKTAAAATLALESCFPFIKLVTAESMVGFSEQAKCSQIAKVFEDAYKSSLSVVVLDEIERLLEYVPIGPRFSNVCLQALLVLLKRKPPPGHKLFVLGTTSSADVMSCMGLDAAFSYTVELPCLDAASIRSVVRTLDVFPERDLEAAVNLLDRGLSLKRLLMLLELAKQESKSATIHMDTFVQVLEDLTVGRG